MNRKEARLTADRITNEEILEMFRKAKEQIKDWAIPSIVNPTATKGLVWNTLTVGFDVSKECHVLHKTNIIREFAEFLPERLKPVKKEKKTKRAPTHGEPDLDNIK